MPTRSRNLPLLCGAIFSLIVHAALILPFLIVAMTSSRQTLGMSSNFKPEDFMSPEEEAPPEDPVIDLGLDAPNPANFTWIGYEEYEKHIAQRAAFEQAAFTATPMSPAAPPSTPAPPAPDLAATTDSIQTPETAAESPSEVAAVESPLTAADLAEMLGFADLVPLPDEKPEPAAATAGAPDPDESIRRLLERIAQMVGQAPRPTENAKPAPAQQPPAPLSPPSPEVKPLEAPPAEPNVNPRPGEPANKDSAATSIRVPLDQLRPGKPIAQHGLLVEPREPEITHLTRLTSSPCNPLVEVNFGSGGKPLSARVVETSCDRRLDAAIESSLYTWRAKGEELKRLGKDETITVRVRIILNPRIKP